MKYSGWDFLEHMLKACEDINEFMTGVTSVTEFTSNKMLRSAVTMELFNFSELVKKTTEDGTLSGKTKPWRDIVRFRDKVGHWYTRLDFESVYDIVTNHLPAVHAYLKEQKRGQP